MRGETGLSSAAPLRKLEALPWCTCDCAPPWTLVLRCLSPSQLCCLQVLLIAFVSLLVRALVSAISCFICCVYSVTHTPGQHVTPASKTENKSVAVEQLQVFFSPCWYFVTVEISPAQAGTGCLFRRVSSKICVCSGSRCILWRLQSQPSCWAPLIITNPQLIVGTGGGR